MSIYVFRNVIYCDLNRNENGKKLELSRANRTAYHSLLIQSSDFVNFFVLLNEGAKFHQPMLICFDSFDENSCKNKYIRYVHKFDE